MTATEEDAEREDAYVADAPAVAGEEEYAGEAAEQADSAVDEGLVDEYVSAMTEGTKAVFHAEYKMPDDVVGRMETRVDQYMWTREQGHETPVPGTPRGYEQAQDYVTEAAAYAGQAQELWSEMGPAEREDADERLEMEAVLRPSPDVDLEEAEGPMKLIGSLAIAADYVRDIANWEHFRPVDNDPDALQAEVDALRERLEEVDRVRQRAVEYTVDEE